MVFFCFGEDGGFSTEKLKGSGGGGVKEGEPGLFICTNKPGFGCFGGLPYICLFLYLSFLFFFFQDPLLKYCLWSTATQVKLLRPENWIQNYCTK